MPNQTDTTVRLCGHDIPRPGHICAFFNSREEEYSTLLPYLKQGVEAGDDVINVLDESRLADHLTRLEEIGIEADSGHISVSSSEAVYLRDGRFEMDRMITFLETRLATAKLEGRRVRTAGWMDWLHRDVPGAHQAMEYEARMNDLIPVYDCTFMCVYDLEQLSGGMVADIMATHPWVILNGEIRQNSFYVPPDIYLQQVFAKKKSGAAANKA